MKSKFNFLLASAVLMAATPGISGTGTDAAPAAPAVKPGDENLHPAVQKLLVTVDAVDEQILYTPDPRVQVKALTESLAEYFRTPD